MYMWNSLDFIANLKKNNRLCKKTISIHHIHLWEEERGGGALFTSFCVKSLCCRLFLCVSVPQTCFRAPSMALAYLPWKAATRALQQQWTQGQVSKFLFMRDLKDMSEYLHSPLLLSVNSASAQALKAVWVKWTQSNYQRFVLVHRAASYFAISPCLKLLVQRFKPNVLLVGLSSHQYLMKYLMFYCVWSCLGQKPELSKHLVIMVMAGDIFHFAKSHLHFH